MLFVDHNDFQSGQARKNGHARAQHNAGSPGVGGQPAFQALHIGHTAVHADHGLSAKHGHEARFKALLQLGRQVDFRHHDQSLGLWVGLQRLLHHAHVHLGFAAAGAAVKQEGAGMVVDLAENALLLVAERYGF